MNFQLTTTWFAGLILGTFIIAVTSPLFVRSYVPEVYDADRGANVLASTDQYRWRSEGYAASVIGPHGMVGRAELPAKENAIRVALWGDSQAEGVCVADDEKLFRQIEQELGMGINCVLPFARSGDDAADWLTQMPDVESNFDIGAHVVLIVEMSDLYNAAEAPIPIEPVVDQSLQARVASSAPAFMIQGARNLLTSAEGGQRKLRFAIGPVSRPVASNATVLPDVDWKKVVDALKQRSHVPVIVVYAPPVPSVFYGVVEMVHQDHQHFQRFEAVAAANGIAVVDTSDDLGRAAREGRWPRGFHNGQIGAGHLNASGYRIIAQRVAPVIAEVLDAR